MAPLMTLRDGATNGCLPRRALTEPVMTSATSTARNVAGIRTDVGVRTIDSRGSVAPTAKGTSEAKAVVQGLDEVVRVDVQFGVRARSERIALGERHRDFPGEGRLQPLALVDFASSASPASGSSRISSRSKVSIAVSLSR